MHALFPLVLFWCCGVSKAVEEPLVCDEQDAPPPVGSITTHPGPHWNTRRLESLKAVNVDTPPFAFSHNWGMGVDVYMLGYHFRCSHPELSGAGKCIAPSEPDFGPYRATRGDRKRKRRPWGMIAAGVAVGKLTGVARRARLIGLKYSFTARKAPAALRYIAEQVMSRRRPAVLWLPPTSAVFSSDKDALPAAREALRFLVQTAGAVVVSNGDFDTGLSVRVGTTLINDTAVLNFGKATDIYAPGEGVTGPDYESDGYLEKSGSWTSAAHVTGVVAAYLSSNPGATPSEVKAWLRGTALTGILVNSKDSVPPPRLLHLPCCRRLQQFRPAPGDGAPLSHRPPAEASSVASCWEVECPAGGRVVMSRVGGTATGEVWVNGARMMVPTRGEGQVSFYRHAAVRAYTLLKSAGFVPKQFEGRAECDGITLTPSWSSNGALEGAAPLDGAVVSGVVHIFLRTSPVVADSIRDVSWEVLGLTPQTRKDAPFRFLNGGLDTRWQGDNTAPVRVVVTFRNGARTELVLSFRIVSTAELVWGERQVPLDGLTVNGKGRLAVVGGAAAASVVSAVKFYCCTEAEPGDDSTPLFTGIEPPFELGAVTGGKLFDTRLFADGVLTVVADVIPATGSQEPLRVRAVFTVANAPDTTDEALLALRMDDGEFLEGSILPVDEDVFLSVPSWAGVASVRFSDARGVSSYHDEHKPFSYREETFDGDDGEVEHSPLPAEMRLFGIGSHEIFAEVLLVGGTTAVTVKAEFHTWGVLWGEQPATGQLLDGGLRVSGQGYVSVVGPRALEGAQSATFRCCGSLRPDPDDGIASSTRKQPFLMDNGFDSTKASQPFDTRLLSDGNVYLVAEVRRAVTQPKLSIGVRFRINNQPADTTTSSFALQAATTSSGPFQFLDGSSFSVDDDVFIFLPGSAEVRHVTFYDPNFVSYHEDDTPPFLYLEEIVKGDDGAEEQHPVPISMRRFGAGSHKILASVRFREGRNVILVARFEVHES